MNEGAEAKGKFQSFRVSDGSPELRLGESFLVSDGSQELRFGRSF